METMTRVSFHARVNKNLKADFDLALAEHNLESMKKNEKVMKQWEALEFLMRNFIRDMGQTNLTKETKHD